MSRQAGSPGNRIRDALRHVVEALEESGRPNMIIGGIAVIAHGVERLTRDVDATVAGEGTDLDALAATLARHGLAPRVADAIPFARRSQVLLLRHVPSGVEVDLSLAWLPFELEAIEAAEPADVGGVRLPLVRPEDLVVYKVVAWRPQDQLDIEGLVARHGVRMDIARVRRLAREIADALDDPGRVHALERILARAQATRP